MGKTLKLTDLNYNQLLFGKFLNEFTGILGDYKSLGDDTGWFDLSGGEILGNFEYSDSLMKTILTSQEPFFIISEDFLIDEGWDRRIYLGAPMSLFEYTSSDGYNIYTWKNNRAHTQWEEQTSGYYDRHTLEYNLLLNQIPIAFNFDMKNFDELLYYVRKELSEGNAFYWR
jgi:hypothetical protein